MMFSRLWLFLVIILFIVIVVLSWVLFTTPRNALNPLPVATSTVAEPTTHPGTPPEPLSAHVSMTSPQSGANVGHTFDIAGQAPGQWFFEAQFPIQVRDPQDNIVGRATGSAQGDWMTEKLVAFKAMMRIDDAYHGPATLILMKDNPSGLPENDDSVTIPIVVE